MKVEPITTCVDDPPSPTPTTRPIEEVTVKQEFIEQCARRRPPLKERYQSQFNELMQLEIDNMRLRKRVLCLQRGARRYRKKIAKLKTGVFPLAAQTRQSHCFCCGANKTYRPFMGGLVIHFDCQD